MAVEQKDQLIAPQPAEGGTGSVAREGWRVAQVSHLGIGRTTLSASEHLEWV